ncbi:MULTISPECIES: hypothetical protein [Streptomyces]|uniref:Uncharacterized protein n=2 Tax=Streptomyces TaxID=1883 RepID=A0A2U9P6Q6_STRAS|nr:hypothetical protein [Streptomyces actuosus]AWT45212.1 hypothetical protein DMT42_24955 [Streptomyces actuosus]MBM4821804.1 hypothetical protein [Streptomyces actuosus]
MAWDEWEQLKSQAQARQQGSAQMQLNHVPVEPSGNPQGDLAANQSDLAAVGDAAYDLHQAFKQYSDQARISSMKAAGGLKSEGFEIGSALDHVAEHWVDQVQSLLDATAHISNHLDYTQGAHAGDEVYIAGTISSIATLDQGFDERKVK